MLYRREPGQMRGLRREEKRIGVVQGALPRLFALLLCLSFMLPWKMQAAAAESGAQPQNPDQVMIRVEAQQEAVSRAALLERINAIRAEACEEGVNNPVNGEPMTPADYVPLQWSEELEEIALLRAAESLILQDHMRPDGTECFTAAPEGVSYTMETLAWGFESAADAVEGWYSEKGSYVEPDGKPAGHYMALINPQNRFVGIAALRAPWQRNACDGAFGSSGTAAEMSAGSAELSAGSAEAGAGSAEASVGRAEAGAGGIENAGGLKVWMIPLRRDLLPAVTKRAVEVAAARILRAAIF